MILNVHKRGREVVVAACDEAILDKTFRGGGLKLHVSRTFYGEEICSEKQLISALRNCTSANLAGEEVIAVAIKAGFIEKECVMYIGKVPHAQLYKVNRISCAAEP